MNGTYRPMRSEEAMSAMHLMSQALHFSFDSDEQMQQWLKIRGLENMRVIELDGQLAATINILPMGQWFGGVSIATAGIAGVGVAPEFRGRKVGYTLMSEMLREMRAADYPLSTLYPATSRFYRGLGYERAGARMIYKVPVTLGDINERSITYRKVDTSQAAVREQFQSLYRRWASAQQGLLDRGPQLWTGLLEPLSGKWLYYLLESDGEAVGYLIYKHGGQQEDIVIRDWCALSPAALRGIAQFIADHRSMVSHVQWPGAPIDLLNHLFPEQEYTVQWRMDWMLRILNIETALQRRRYPASLNLALELAVTDELFPENAGMWVLHVKDGTLQLTRGGSGSDVALHIRDLAAIYSNYLSARQLRLIGSVQASDDAAQVLETIFAAPIPWMPDMF